MKNIRVVDEHGNSYGSIRQASIGLGFDQNTLHQAWKRNGFQPVMKWQGHTLHFIGEGRFSPKDTAPTSETPETQAPQAPLTAEEKLLEAIKNRYSQEELKAIAEGQLKDRNLQYQKPVLHGTKYRIGVMSDTHIGSVYSPEEWLLEAFKEMEAQHCSCVLHTGDIVEGLKRNRADTQIYELSEIGYQAQRDKAVELFSKCNIPVYAISGNHDFFFKDNGADIVEDICSRVPNMEYLGHDQADIECDGAIIRLFHGGDGSSYAHSYRLQKLIESFSGGKKPNILFAGHVHKFCHIFERNVQAISIPCMQMQTGFMKAKKLPAHAGFLICDFEVCNGNICNFSVKMYPFYE